MPSGKDVNNLGRRGTGGTTKKNAFCSFCRKSYRDVGPLVEGPGKNGPANGTSATICRLMSGTPMWPRSEHGFGSRRLSPTTDVSRSWGFPIQKAAARPPTRCCSPQIGNGSSIPQTDPAILRPCGGTGLYSCWNGTRPAPGSDGVVAGSPRGHRRVMHCVWANRIRTAETTDRAAHESSVSRKTVAEVPFARLSFRDMCRSSVGPRIHGSLDRFQAQVK